MRDGWRAFSDLQWYQARSGLMVHLVLGSPNDLSEDTFRALLADAVRHAPLLDFEESPSDAAVGPAASGLAERASYTRLPEQSTTLAEIDARLRTPEGDRGNRAARAFCIASATPDANGTRSWMVVEAPHSLVEGADVAAILGGKALKHTERAAHAGRLTPFQRLAVPLITTLVCTRFTISGWFNRRRQENFAPSRIVLNRRDVDATARRLGVGKRALLFGLAIHGALVPAGKRRVSITYTGLSHTQDMQGDDAYFHLRLDELHHRVPRTGVEEGIRALARDLDTRKPSAAFMHAVEMGVIRLQRRIDRRLPWLFPPWYFGSFPGDMVLSLLPPLRLRQRWTALGDATAMAGLSGGAIPTCIYTVQPDTVTLSLWLPRPGGPACEGILRVADDLGIGARTASVPE